MARISLVAPDFLTKSDERLCLEAKGHQVVVRSDVAQALEGLLNDPPDILIIQKDLHRHLDREVIHALKNNLQLALFPILLVVSESDLISGIDLNVYPVDDLISDQTAVEQVVTRVDLSLARSQRIADNNPLTKLPGNSSILKRIQDLLDRGLDTAVAYVDIDYFKPYNDLYGFARGDEVIRMVARILVNVVQEKAKAQGFVGHIGGDDFVFTVPLKMAEDICREILKNFSSLIPLFLDKEELATGFFFGKDRKGKEQKFSITSLSIAVVLCPKGRYAHYGEVAAVAAQLKKKVKTFSGSNFLIDRRRQ